VRGSLGSRTILTASSCAVAEDVPLGKVTNKRVATPLRQGLVGLLAACIFSGAAPALGSTRVSFDCGASHSFGGFGLNVWPLAARMQPLLQLADELVVKFVRSPVPADVRKFNDPEPAHFGSLVDRLEALVLARTRGSVSEAFSPYEQLRSLGIDQMTASWGFPEAWRRTRPGQATPDGHIDDLRIDDYGRLLAAQLAVLLRHKIRPQTMEPESELGNRLTPPQYARLLKSFRHWQSQVASPPVPLAGPGTVLTWNNAPYLQELIKQDQRLDIVSTHAYDALKTHQLASLGSLRAAIPPGWKQPLYVTEYGIDADLWYRSPDAADTEPYAVRAAAQTLALLGSGANAVFYWQAQDPPWAKPPNWGLLSKEDRKRPAIGALRTIVRPLQVGDNIVSSGQRETALPAMLVARPMQLVLQIANPEPDRQDYDISFRNCTVGPISIARSEAWPAGREVEARPAPEAGLRISLPGDTVVSITTTR
jgi:hypothetical protein